MMIRCYEIFWWWCSDGGGGGDIVDDDDCDYIVSFCVQDNN